jgi:hypothetical protein
MPTHQLLSVSLPRTAKTDDRFSRSFASARVLVEGRMRGQKVDLGRLADELRPLPEAARRSLLSSVDRETRDSVRAQLAGPTRRA